MSGYSVNGTAKYSGGGYWMGYATSHWLRSLICP